MVVAPHLQAIFSSCCVLLPALAQSAVLTNGAGLFSVLQVASLSSVQPEIFALHSNFFRDLDVC